MIITVLLICTVLPMYMFHAMLSNLTNSTKNFCLYSHLSRKLFPTSKQNTLQTVFCSIFDTHLSVRELQHCRGTQNSKMKLKFTDLPTFSIIFTCFSQINNTGVTPFLQWTYRCNSTIPAIIAASPNLTFVHKTVSHPILRV
jgi:hypothetical protein